MTFIPWRVVNLFNTDLGTLRTLGIVLDDRDSTTKGGCCHQGAEILAREAEHKHMDKQFR